MALTLIKEDGTAKVDANSYADASDGDAYHDGHLYASAWTAATTANITQRSINVTADAKAKVYGNTDPALTFTAEANSTNRGLVGSDTFTGVLTRTAGESVGSYTINAAGLANGNYLITANNGVLTINPAAPILSPPALTPNPVIPPEAVLNATSQIQSAFTVFNPLEHHPTLLISPTINNREANPYLQEVVVVDNKETRIGIGGSGPTLRILSGGVTLLDNSVDVNEKDKP